MSVVFVFENHIYHDLCNTRVYACLFFDCLFYEELLWFNYIPECIGFLDIEFERNSGISRNGACITPRINPASYW